MTDESGKDLGECILTVAALVVGVPASTIAKGWAFCKLWGWFVIPTFGLPAIPIGRSIGIAALIFLLTHQISECEKEEKSATVRLVQAVAVGVLGPLLTVGFAWIVLQFAK